MPRCGRHDLSVPVMACLPAGHPPPCARPAGLRKWASQFPSAVFEKSGVKRFSLADRAGCYLARGMEYSLAGLACGVVGQGIASGMMELK